MSFTNLETIVLVIVVVSILTAIVKFIIKKLIPLAITYIVILGVLVYLGINYM